jgi:hypothetical protein
MTHMGLYATIWKRIAIKALPQIKVNFSLGKDKQGSPDSHPKAPYVSMKILRAPNTTIIHALSVSA